jgi:hypothetical protein
VAHVVQVTPSLQTLQWVLIAVQALQENVLAEGA